MHILIRSESESDIPAIRRVQIEAFKTHPHSNQTEHIIVDRMRESGDLSISLVAEVDGQVVGHIAFSGLIINDHPSNHALLGPLGVLPEYQKRGLGTNLVHQGLDALRRLGLDSCVLFGDPNYYNRLGFQESTDLRHEGIPQHLLLECKLRDHHVSGSVRFNSCFYGVD